MPMTEEQILEISLTEYHNVSDSKIANILLKEIATQLASLNERNAEFDKEFNERWEKIERVLSSIDNPIVKMMLGGK